MILLYSLFFYRMSRVNAAGFSYRALRHGKYTQGVTQRLGKLPGKPAFGRTAHYLAPFMFCGRNP